MIEWRAIMVGCLARSHDARQVLDMRLHHANCRMPLVWSRSTVKVSVLASVRALPRSHQPMRLPLPGVELYKTAYWNGPTAPLAVSTGSADETSLKVPPVWVDV